MIREWGINGDDVDDLRIADTKNRCGRPIKKTWKRLGPLGWVTLNKKRVARPPPWKVFALEDESAGQTNFTRKHDIWYIFDFSLFVHNCMYNSPHLKERQPNIIVLQCDGLIKMVIFTIWYSSHCNILHLRDWVQKVITRHNWTTHAATEMDKKENKTEKKAKEKKVDKKYCNAYQQEKKDSSTKTTRKKCKTCEIGRRPKWCFIQIDLKMHKCPPDHLHKCPRVLAETRNCAFDLKISLGMHNIKRRIWKRRETIWIFFDQFPNVDLRYIMVKCTKGEVVNVENKKIYQHFSLI